MPSHRLLLTASLVTGLPSTAGLPDHERNKVLRKRLKYSLASKGSSVSITPADQLSSYYHTLLESFRTQGSYINVSNTNSVYFLSCQNFATGDQARGGSEPA